MITVSEILLQWKTIKEGNKMCTFVSFMIIPSGGTGLFFSFRYLELTTNI